MPDIQQMLTINRVMRSQSGKTISLLSHDDRWYSSKCWDLETMALPYTIYAQTSENDYNGKPMYWINDYTMPEVAGGPAVPSQPVMPPPQPPKPHSGLVPGVVNRDASIVAQTLCKTITFTGVSGAIAAYKALYAEYLAWADRGCTDAPPVPAMPDDNIPF